MNNNRNQRFQTISATADKFVEDKGVSPSEVSGYAVSMAAFGRKPNGDFYTLFEEWLKQRHAVPGAPPVDMPADAAADLDEWTDHLKAQIMQRVTGIVRGVAGSFEQTTAMRVVALERLCADQARRNSGVIETLLETEGELDDARKRISALTDEARQEREQVQRLRGRLEERDALLDVLRPHMATGSAAPVALSDPVGDQTPGNGGGLLGGEGSAGAIMMPADKSADSIGEPQQPAIETDPRSGGQAEMPLVISDDADQADVAGDDQG